MTPNDTLLRPTVHFSDASNGGPLLKSLARDFAPLSGAEHGKLLGIAIGHGVGPRYAYGSVSEYRCAFLANGDDASCDGAVMAMPPAASRIVGDIVEEWLPEVALARHLRERFGLPDGEFESIHFRHLTVLFSRTMDDGQPGDIDAAHIFMQRPASAKDARARCNELHALFEFLHEWHDDLKGREVTLPRPETLVEAA